MRALVFGSANLDKTYHVESIVSEGMTVSCTAMDQACGGKGFNQAIALGRAGVHTYFAGAVGSDGSALIDELQKTGIDTRYLMRRGMPSGHAIIQLDAQGRNCIVVCPGANDSVTKSDIDGVLESFGEGDVLVVQNEMSNTNHAINVARKRGIVVALNPSPMNAKVLEWDVASADYLFVNESEGESLSGKKAPEDILNSLHTKFPKTCVVLTLGEKGSLCVDGDGTRASTAAWKVDAVDTTAAGDTFTGYFLAARLEGRSLEEALRVASVASGIAVTRRGAAPSIPVREEVATIMASACG